MQSTRITEICDRLAMIFLCLFAGECVLGGAGRWLSFGFLSIRILLFVICFVLMLPALMRNFRKIFVQPCVWLCLALGVYVLIATVIGWRRGNSFGFIWGDISSYLPLALLPGFLATVRDRKRMTLLTDVIFYAALVLSALTAILHFYLAFATDYAINDVNIWLNAHHMGGLANLGNGVLRIYIRSHIFLQVAILLGLYKAWTVTGWKRWAVLAAAALIAFACLLTYTRGFWLGLLLSAVLVLVLAPQYWKRYLIAVCVFAVLICALFAVSWGAYGQPLAALEVAARFDPDLIPNMNLPTTPTQPVDPSAPTVPPVTEPPDANELAVQLREESLAELSRRIRLHPLFGSGLGTNLDGLRDDGKTEYLYHDTLMKLGAVGFLLFFAVFFLPSARLGKAQLLRIKGRTHPDWDSEAMRNIIVLCGYLGVAVTSYVNPFLLSPMGILLFLLTASAAQGLEGEPL